MKVIIRAKAADDLDRIFAWIAKENVEAARMVVQCLRRKIDVLEMPECSRIGRIGRDEGTRELIDGRYIIVYVVEEEREQISVLAIFHSSRGCENLL